MLTLATTTGVRIRFFQARRPNGNTVSSIAVAFSRICSSAPDNIFSWIIAVSSRPRTMRMQKLSRSVPHNEQILKDSP